MCLLELEDSLPGDIDGLGHEGRIPFGRLEEVRNLLFSGRSFLGNLAKVEVVTLAFGRESDEFAVLNWSLAFDRPRLSWWLSFSGHGGVDHALGEIGQSFQLLSL